MKEFLRVMIERDIRRQRTLAHEQGHEVQPYDIRPVQLRKQVEQGKIVAEARRLRGRL